MSAHEEEQSAACLAVVYLVLVIGTVVVINAVARAWG